MVVTQYQDFWDTINLINNEEVLFRRKLEVLTGTIIRDSHDFLYINLPSYNNSKCLPIHPVEFINSLGIPTEEGTYYDFPPVPSLEDLATVLKKLSRNINVVDKDHILAKYFEVNHNTSNDVLLMPSRNYKTTLNFN